MCRFAPDQRWRNRRMASSSRLPRVCHTSPTPMLRNSLANAGMSSRSRPEIQDTRGPMGDSSVTMVGTVRARLTIGGLGAPGSRDFALAYFFEDRNDVVGER